MSTCHQFSSDHDLLDDRREHDSLSVRERTLGHLLVIAVILLALYLRSLS